MPQIALLRRRGDFHGRSREAQREKPVVAVAGTTFIHIVDDDVAVRDAFARLLRSAGLESRAYDCAETFLAEVRNAPGACVLLDITMPGMTGPQVQAGLKDKGIVLPVITISARDDDETRTCARALGASMFLRKPVDDQALLDAINWVIGSSHGR